MYLGYRYKKRLVVSRQPISIVNLKSNTMKNTVQIYRSVLNCASVSSTIVSNLTLFLNVGCRFYFYRLLNVAF